MTAKAEHNRKMIRDNPSLLSDNFQEYFMDVYENNNKDLEIAILNGIKRLEQENKILKNSTITNNMKTECIGEFSWEEYSPYYDEEGKEYDGTKVNTVPWDLCKDIYKKMHKVKIGDL